MEKILFISYCLFSSLLKIINFLKLTSLFNNFLIYDFPKLPVAPVTSIVLLRKIFFSFLL